jgi:hypothetical protein
MAESASIKTSDTFNLLTEPVLSIDTSHTADDCLRQMLLEMIPLHELHQFLLVIGLIVKIVQTVVMLYAYL